MEFLFEFLDRFPVGDDFSVCQMDIDVMVLHFEIQDIRWFDPNHFVPDQKEEICFVLPVMKKEKLIHDKGEIRIRHRLQDEVESLHLIAVYCKLGKVGDEDDGDVLVLVSESIACIDSVDAWHVDIHEDAVIDGGILLQEIVSVCERMDFDQEVSFLGEAVAEFSDLIDLGWLVFNDGCDYFFHDIFRLYPLPFTFQWDFP